MINKLPFKTTCFYSYKGGTGRTALLARIAHEIKSVDSHRVCCLDFDLEAPGFEVFFQDNLAKTSVFGAVVNQNFDLLKDEVIDDLCVIGTRTEHLNKNLYKEFRERFQGPEGLAELNSSIREFAIQILAMNDYDHLLIDNRSGFPLTAENFFQLSNHIVFVIRPDIQNQNILQKWLFNYLGQLRIVNQELKVSVVINLLPPVESLTAQQCLGKFLKESGLKEEEKKGTIKVFQVPYFSEVFFDERKIFEVEHEVFQELADYILN